MNLIDLQEIISQSRQIVFFGGAGTSTESGIPDFRSTTGLFHSLQEEEYSPEEILSHDFFLEHTTEFYRFYKEKMIYAEASPNPAHEALVELERRGQLSAIITQNIDGLHQMAGNTNVLELHGSIHRNYCMDCRAFYPLDYVVNSSELVPPCEQCGGVIKPDVVLYQESLDMELLYRAVSYIQQADTLIVAGTSLTVQPAASLIRYYGGDRFILINQSETPLDGLANITIRDSIAKIMTALVKTL